LNSALSAAEIWHLKECVIKVKYHCSVRLNESSQFSLLVCGKDLIILDLTWEV